MAATVTHTTIDTAPGAPDTRLTVGVGEKINFESDVAGNWTANLSRRTANARNTTTFQWNAPTRPGSATITFTAGNATPITKDVTIIAPTLTYENPRALAFPGEAAGVAGAQMETDVTYGPNTVSFANTFWWEKPGPGSGGTGGFARARLPYHRPNPRDLQIGSNNSGPTDRAGFWGFRPDRRTGTYSAGSFRWVIPTYYKCTGETSRQLIQNVDQVCDLAADGTVTVTKLGTPFSRSP